MISYHLFRCWVSEYTALPALDAATAAVAIQTIKLELEGWERDTAVTEPAESLAGGRVHDASTSGRHGLARARATAPDELGQALALLAPPAIDEPERLSARRRRPAPAGPAPAGDRAATSS